MDVYEIRTNTKEILYKGGDYNLAVQSYYDFVEEAENDIDSKLFGLRIIGYVNGKKDNELYEKGGKIKSGPKYKKGQALIKDDKIYRVVSVLRDTNNDFHYRISSDRTDMIIVKENELKLAKDYHESKMRGADNEMNKLLIIDDYAKTESEIMRDDEIYEDDKKAEIYVKEVHSYIKRNNYPKRMSMSTFKELEKENKHLLNNTLALLGMYGPEMRKTYMEAYKESKNMYINPKVLKEKYNEKTYKEKIAILEMLKKDMEKDADVSKKDILKMEMKIDMLKDKTTTTFEKGGKVGYEININKLTLENIERATELEQDALMRGIDVRRSGNIVIIRDYDKIDDVIALLKYNLTFAYPQTKLSFKKGGTLTYKQKYNKKYGYPKNEGHSLKEISKDTGVSKKGLQQIYNKGVGAYKTNPQSVRPNVKSAEQWAQARVYSAVMGGKAAKVDAKELKMAKGGLVKVREAIEYDNNNFGERKKLDLEKGSRNWRGFYLDIQPLVWARNYQDGYNVDVYDEKYGRHLGTLNIDYSGGSMVIREESFKKGGLIEAKEYFIDYGFIEDLRSDERYYVEILLKDNVSKKEVAEAKNYFYQTDNLYGDKKHYVDNLIKHRMRELYTFAKGGEVDLFDHYEKLPPKAKKIVDRYMKKYEEGDYNYEDSKKFLKEMEKAGYTFDYGLDNEPYDLRKMAKGGALEKEFKFDKNFVVYVPSTSDVSDKISPKELDDRVNEVKEYVANTFGGYTETETEGGYKSSKGEIVEEDVVKVSVFSKNKDWKEKEYEVVKKAKEWAKEWGQEAIGFEYEGDLYYIDGDGKMEKGGLTPSKAKKILKDGTAQGKPLTEKQKRYFGYMASQDKK